VVLIVGSVLVLSEAIPRLLNPESPNAAGMIVFALGGILANGLAVLRLRGGKSLNARVVAWHLLEDVLGWTAVLIVSLILLLWDVPILDPILSILITLYILYNVIQNLRRTLRLFLQAVPEGMELEQIENRLLALEPVCSIHHTHVWSLDGEHHVLTTHVVVEEGTSRKTIQELKRSIHALSAEYDLVHTTVEVEYADEDCGMISHSERLEATQET
jgi:cobalt-zinc-cadmium efflux system protein